MLTRIPIWIDCDPGHDDVMAILLGCFNPSFNLLGISTSYGNAPSECTSYNALSFLTALNKYKDIPVYQGAVKPWIREPEYASNIHGSTGLDGTNLLPVPKAKLQQGSYLDAIENCILTYKKEISIISIGPLTSIATLFREKPHLKHLIKFVSIMGGGFKAGNKNKTNTAEFNIWCDPHAANFIFHDSYLKNKCILIPLDLTHKVITTKKIREIILGEGVSRIRRLISDLLAFVSASYEASQGFTLGAPLHDPLTLLPLLQFYETENSEAVKLVFMRMDLDVITESNEFEGKMISLKKYECDATEGTIVCFNLNIELFWNLIFDSISKAELSSSI